MELEFTSDNCLTLIDLIDVFYVTEVRKFGCLLNKSGFKLLFEADKFVMSKGGIFVGKGYLYGGMFKLKILLMLILLSLINYGIIV